MIASIYLACLALLYVALSIRTLRTRRRLKIAIGDGGNPIMLRAIRVHSNFAEYVPIGVLLLIVTEFNRAPAALVHLLGICLLVGRLLHAYGVSQEDERFLFRVYGMALTFACYVLAAGFLIYVSFRMLAAA